MELEANAVPCAPCDAPPLLLSSESLFDIATREVDTRSVNFTLLRHLPGGRTLTVKLSDIPLDF